MSEPVLEGARLSLVPLLEEHADALLPALSCPDLYTFIPTMPPSDLSELRARFRRLEKRASPDGTERWLNWAARLGAGSAWVGLFEATIRADRTALLAYFVFADHQRRGLGIEGAGLVVSHLFRACGVSLVSARIDTRNAASIRLVERVGFSRVAVIPGADHFKGSASDEYEYALAAPPPPPPPPP